MPRVCKQMIYAYIKNAFLNLSLNIMIFICVEKDNTKLYIQILCYNDTLQNNASIEEHVHTTVPYYYSYIYVMYLWQSNYQSICECFIIVSFIKESIMVTFVFSLWMKL